MIIIIKAFCMKGGRQFDKLDCQDVFSDYFDSGKFPGVTGGYMSFSYNKEKDELNVITAYDTTRKLSEQEEKELIEYTQGQWSDGIGEGFEQQTFQGEENYDDPEHFDDDVIYNPSPWHFGQIAKLSYINN